MTSIHNLKSIVKAKALVCKSETGKNYINFEDISNHDVQDKRAQKQIHQEPGGTLCDYVPFYFWGLSPMLFVNRHRQDEIIYIVSRPELIEESGQPYFFTDRHAVLQLAKFGRNLADLDKFIDMNIIKDRYWLNTPDQPDKKERKQAEFLVYKHVKLAWCAGIVTLNEKVKSYVGEILNKNEISMPVKVYAKWYY